MVAPGSTTSVSIGRTPNQAVSRMGYGPVSFNLVDVENMVKQGVLPEDSTIELLDGALIYRDRFDLRGDEVVEGIKHNIVMSKLADLNGRLKSPARHLRSQSVLICSDTHAPIPDAVILRGELDDYDQLASAADSFCVIEVAFSSYERDTGSKLKNYARAGVKQYVVINLRNYTAEVYANPDISAGTYAPPLIVDEAGILSLQVEDGKTFEVPLAELFPKRR